MSSCFMNIIKGEDVFKSWGRRVRRVQGEEPEQRRKQRLGREETWAGAMERTLI